MAHDGRHRLRRALGQRGERAVSVGGELHFGGVGQEPLANAGLDHVIAGGEELVGER